MTKYNNKVIWTYVTRVFSFFTLSTFLPFLKISENNIKRLWTYLKCPFSGHRLWSDTDNIIKRKSYIIHNIWPSEFVITGEGTVINFPYIQLPFINCNNKGSICSSKAFLWFPLVSFLLFFFYLVLVVLFWLVSSKKIRSSFYNKLPAEMKYWSICYIWSKLSCKVKPYLAWLSEPHATSLYRVLFEYFRKRLVRIFQNSHNLQQIYKNT